MISTEITVVLMPGLHGTEGLFKPFVSFKPDNVTLITISYSTTEVQSYQELQSHYVEQIKNITTPFILVGESFSGPLSLLLAREHPNLLGVILVGSFISAPITTLARYLPWTLLFTMAKLVFKPFVGIIHWYPESLLLAAMVELRKSRSAVLANRVHALLKVNVSEALKACPVPIMYFRGEHDFVVRERSLKQIQTVRPTVKVVCFNTHHFILQSKPAQAWKAVTQFWQPSKSDKR